MYPLLFLQIFPLFIVHNRPPNLIGSYPPTVQHLVTRPSFPVSSSQNYVEGQPLNDNTRRASVNNYDYDRGYRVTISFPGRNDSGNTNEAKNGALCFTYDGRSGVCRQRFECKAYTQYTAGFAQKITKCQRGQSTATTLLCCPGETLGGQQTSQVFDVPTTQLPALTTPYPTFTNTPITTNPPPTVDGISNSVDFSSDDSQKVCGAFDPTKQSSWPWIVSIGQKNKTMVHMSCLGSLITTEYILTSAKCLQEGSPTVVAVGHTIIGDISIHQLKEQHIVLHTIAESIQHEKFVYPSMYKNIGLIRLTTKVTVSPKVLPVCFPFLAGVLDIIDFAGQYASTSSLRLSVRQDPGIQTFEIKQYRIFKNNLCDTVLKKNPSSSLREKIPRGIKPEIMCVISRTKTKDACPVSGAPLVLFDSASNSFVQIGIAVGDPTCSDLEGRIVMFTRINSFSSWVRDHVSEFPTPPPCYV